MLLIDERPYIYLFHLPNALLWANNDATVFFFGLLTPLPKFLGRPSLWFIDGIEGIVVLAVEVTLHVPLGDAEFSARLGGRGESAVANNWTNDALGAPGGSWEEDDDCDEDGITRRGFGPGFLRAVMNAVDDEWMAK